MTRPDRRRASALRNLVRETALKVGREAAREAMGSGRGWKGALVARQSAAAPLMGLRFHDLRHQAITELAEAGASDATMMAVASHMSRRMLEH